MKRVYIRFAHITGYEVRQYFAAERHHVVTSTLFQSQNKLRALPVMKIILAYGLDFGPDDEDYDEIDHDPVHIIVENVSDDVLMLMMLAIGPNDHLEAW